MSHRKLATILIIFWLTLAALATILVMSGCGTTKNTGGYEPIGPYHINE